MGEGQLKGIAKTSKAYQCAINAVVARTRADQFASEHADARRLRIAADNARMELDKAQTLYSAIKHAVDLKAMILRASST